MRSCASCPCSTAAIREIPRDPPFNPPAAQAEGCPGEPDPRHARVPRLRAPARKARREAAENRSRSRAMTALAPSVRERKFLADPLSGVDAEGVFEGYASLFGEADLGKDVVMPGAFRDSLKKRGATHIRLLWQHDPA